jgi:hypothetical protein
MWGGGGGGEVVVAVLGAWVVVCGECGGGCGESPEGGVVTVVPACVRVVMVVEVDVVIVEVVLVVEVELEVVFVVEVEVVVDGWAVAPQRVRMALVACVWWMYGRGVAPRS